MATRSRASTATKPARVTGEGWLAYWLSSIGSRFISTAAAAVPPRMKGIRRPLLVSVRSEMAPNRGSRNRASTLSAAIMAPETVSLSWKVPARISVMTLSYICQKAEMDKKASPTRMVRMLLSFSSMVIVPLFPAASCRSAWRARGGPGACRRVCHAAPMLSGVVPCLPPRPVQGCNVVKNIGRLHIAPLQVLQGALPGEDEGRVHPGVDAAGHVGVQPVPHHQGLRRGEAGALHGQPGH